MKYSKVKRLRILTAGKFRCTYCGAALTEKTLHIDHVVPKSKGGKNNEANLVASCYRCNGIKGDLSLEDYFWKCTERRQEAEAELRYYASVVEGLESRFIHPPE